MNLGNFLAELKRRNVHRAAIFYAGSAWLLVQVATQVFPFFDIPNATVRMVVFAVAIGFPFAILFSWFYEWTPQGLVPTAEVAPAQSVTRQTGKRLDRAIIAILAVAVVLLLADRLWPRQSGASAEQTIAVLPLVNTTGDPANEYFSDGVSEELISSLSRLSMLRVTARTSSFQFKGKTEDSKTIGDKLGVAYLLEGSVRKSQDRVRVAVALVKVATGTTAWSESFDRQLKDIFAVQTEIAASVAAALQVALLDNNAMTIQQPSAAMPSNGNLEAYNALLQGNFYVAKRNSEDYRRAMEAYETAIRLDPKYALAHAKLAYALSRRVSGSTGLTSEERARLAARAHEVADTALRLDPQLDEAHAARGKVADELDQNLALASTEYRRALELNPNNLIALTGLAGISGFQGHLEEAVVQMQHATTLDPLRAVTYQTTGLYLIGLGRYDDAEAVYRKAIALQPEASLSYSQLAKIEILRGRPAQAIAHARQETDPAWRNYAMALAQEAGGHRAESEAALQALIRDNADDAGYQIAEIYALRGDRDEAFRWLEHAVATGDGGASELLYSPFMLRFRDDPRFTAVARKLGLIAATP